MFFKGNLTHFPFWYAGHCGFLPVVLVCGHVSCIDGSYNLLMRSSSHWQPLIPEAAIEMLVIWMRERK